MNAAPETQAHHAQRVSAVLVMASVAPSLSTAKEDARLPLGAVRRSRGLLCRVLVTGGGLSWEGDCREDGDYYFGWGALTDY